MFQVKFVDSATADLEHQRKYDQQRILQAVEAQLLHQPHQPTRHRKRLDEHPLADWELRVGDFRVFYNVDVEQTLVTIRAIGRKRGNRLALRDKEMDE